MCLKGPDEGIDGLLPFLRVVPGEGEEENLAVRVKTVVAMDNGLDDLGQFCVIGMVDQICWIAVHMTPPF